MQCGRKYAEEVPCDCTLEFQLSPEHGGDSFTLHFHSAVAWCNFTAPVSESGGDLQVATVTATGRRSLRALNLGRARFPPALVVCDTAVAKCSQTEEQLEVARHALDLELHSLDKYSGSERLDTHVFQEIVEKLAASKPEMLVFICHRDEEGIQLPLKTPPALCSAEMPPALSSAELKIANAALLRFLEESSWTPECIVLSTCGAPNDPLPGELVRLGRIVFVSYWGREGVPHAAAALFTRLFVDQVAEKFLKEDYSAVDRYFAAFDSAKERFERELCREPNVSTLKAWKTKMKCAKRTA